MDEKLKAKESWEVWEKLLREEGFVFDPGKKVYLNYDHKMAWGRKDILEEFADTADFREWLKAYKADPKRQREAHEFVDKMVSCITAGKKTCK